MRRCYGAEGRQVLRITLTDGNPTRAILLIHRPLSDPACARWGFPPPQQPLRYNDFQFVLFFFGVTPLPPNDLQIAAGL